MRQGSILARRFLTSVACVLLVLLQGGWNILASLSTTLGDDHNHDAAAAAAAAATPSSSSLSLLTTMTRTPTTTASPPFDTTTNPCQGYAGILHIQHGDKGAAGTAMFFAYVINYLRYAEQNNLLPWIHLDQASPRVFDAAVHGVDPSQSILLQGGTVVGRKQQYSCAKMQIGPIVNDTTNSKQTPVNVTVHGNGIWNTYFQPVSDFDPTHRPCPATTPYVTFTNQDMTWMHYRWPDAVRVWQYMACSQPQPQRGKLHQWYGIMRKRAQPIVARYFRPQPWLQEAVAQANPAAASSQPCLALHVRLTDKSGRDRILLGVDAYWPYVQAYWQHVPEGSIYLGTDSQITLQNITRDWPAAVVRKIRTQPNVLQSANATAVFDLGKSHRHRTNTEILIDVYSMARCQVFVHGHSGVSEAAHYINANLHDCSVDLEDPNKPDVAQFAQMLQQDACRGSAKDAAAI